jgi:hypothetical protein
LREGGREGGKGEEKKKKTIYFNFNKIDEIEKL